MEWTTVDDLRWNSEKDENGAKIFTLQQHKTTYNIQSDPTTGTIINIGPPVGEWEDVE